MSKGAPLHSLNTGPGVRRIGVDAWFYVEFDHTKGNCLKEWKARPGMSSAGIEFKAIPSGLHTVESDVIYFLHDGRIGISACKCKHDKSARGARIIAAGVLTSGHGRLSGTWRYVEALQQLAEQLFVADNEIELIEDFFQAYCSAKDASPLSSPSLLQSRHTRLASISDFTILSRKDVEIPRSHPALSLPKMLERVGPSIFLLYRAALCRKRILFLTELPMQEACHFVYILSIISTAAQTKHMRKSAPPSRLRSLYSVGLYDTDLLGSLSDTHSNHMSDSWHSDNGRTGWIACTTEKIMLDKQQLYDIAVVLPSTDTSRLAQVLKADGSRLKPTKKDAELWCYLMQQYSNVEQDQLLSNLELDETYFETWSDKCCYVFTALAWWAAAGQSIPEEIDDEEQAVDPDDDAFQDQRVDLSYNSPTPESPLLSSSRQPTTPILPFEPSNSHPISGKLSAFVVFHRMTNRIFTLLSSAIEAADEASQPRESILSLSQNELVQLKLGFPLSTQYCDFIQSISNTWFDREVVLPTGWASLAQTLSCCRL